MLATGKPASNELALSLALQRKAAAVAGVKDVAGTDNCVSTKVDTEITTPSPPKKIRHVRWSDQKENRRLVTEVERPPTAKQAHEASSVKGKSQGRTLRKRKRSGESDEEGLLKVSKVSSALSPTPAAAVGVGCGGTLEGEKTQPPPKRSRRGRKPKSERPVVSPVVGTAESNGAAQVPVAELHVDTVATAPAPGTLPPFPDDSLEGATLLARHAVLSQELSRRLENCESKWLAAIQSIQVAKQVLDDWLEVWRSGQS